MKGLHLPGREFRIHLLVKVQFALLTRSLLVTQHFWLHDLDRVSLEEDVSVYVVQENLRVSDADDFSCLLDVVEVDIGSYATSMMGENHIERLPDAQEFRERSRVVILTFLFVSFHFLLYVADFRDVFV